MDSVANATLELIVGLGLLGAIFGSVITLPAIAAFLFEVKEAPNKQNQ